LERLSLQTDAIGARIPRSQVSVETGQRQIDHPIPSGSIFTPQPTRHAREAVEGLTANLTAKHKSGGRSVGLRTHLSWPPAPCIAGQNSRRKRHVQVQELASDKAAGPGREP